MTRQRLYYETIECVLGSTNKVEEVLGHLGSFDPRMANKLARDAGLALERSGS